MRENITWFRQGSHDGLCGFYAALNAIWGLCPDLRSCKVEDLYKDYGRERQTFDEAVKILNRVGGINVNILKSHAAFGGIDHFQIQELVSKLAQFWHIPLVATLLHESNAIASTPHELLKNQMPHGSFAMVCGQYHGGHWVTVREGSSNRLEMIDPAGKEGDGPVDGRKASRPDLRDGVLLSLKT